MRRGTSDTIKLDPCYIRAGCAASGSSVTYTTASSYGPGWYCSDFAGGPPLDVTNLDNCQIHTGCDTATYNSAFDTWVCTVPAQNPYLLLKYGGNQTLGAIVNQPPEDDGN